MPLYDSFPDLFIPIGFAGGLVAPDIGPVRFGYRDYDPTVGRFTAHDPVGNTGGDHDLYDYCVDDPVNLNDPSGLYGQFPALVTRGWNCANVPRILMTGGQWVGVAMETTSWGRAVKGTWEATEGFPNSNWAHHPTIPTMFGVGAAKIKHELNKRNIG